MEDQLISFDTAKLAQEKGFDVEPLWCYDLTDFYTQNIYTLVKYGEEVDGDFELYAPTQSLLQKWLRESHNIIVDVYSWIDHAADVNDGYEYKVFVHHREYRDHFQTYEKALEVGLLGALNLIK